MITHN